MNIGIENEYQEFKEGIGQLDRGIKSLTAMLNKHGSGTLYIGVKDNGDVSGVPIDKDTLMDIRTRIFDKVDPRVYAEIEEKISDDGKHYIKVYASGSDIPYSFDGRFYYRNVSADEHATSTVLRKMLASSESDIIRQRKSPRQDLSFNSLFAILAGSGIHPTATESFLSNYGLLNREGKYNINAYLLADENEISIKVVTFAGNDKTVMSSRTEYGRKCLLIALSEVIHYFESINTTEVNLNSPQREERHLFDMPSFREAWINACLHNDWNNEIAPSIFLFDDRIEIISYGGLPFALSKEGFFKGTSVPVNKSLLTIFMAAKYAEQSGHGVPTIVERYGKEAFSFDDGLLKVTIPLAFYRPEVIRRKTIALHKKGLTVNQKKVYDLLSNNGSLTFQDIADNTALSLSGVKKICSLLQDYGLLERSGSRRDGLWITK